MLTPKWDSDGGKRLRAERERLGLSTREVERLSYELSQKQKNPYYYISRTWVADIEAGKFKPNLFKLHSLSLIYQRDLDEILGFFGLNFREAAREPGLVGLPKTHLIAPVDRAGRSIIAPLELRDRVKIEQTNLVSRMFESWAEVPVGLLQHMDLKNGLYGYIGTKDFMLFPLIRPGSFVQIDARQTKIVRGGWQNEFDRPIYFVELRDGYICSWCELDERRLFLIPTAQSGARTRHVRYPGDADIVGRVTAVTMRIAEANLDPPKGND
jgi:transcriptional regulator with XRE-family HTH domain